MCTFIYTDYSLICSTFILLMYNIDINIIVNIAEQLFCNNLHTKYANKI